MLFCCLWSFLKGNVEIAHTSVLNESIHISYSQIRIINAGIVGFLSLFPDISHNFRDSGQRSSIADNFDNREPHQFNKNDDHKID